MSPPQHRRRQAAIAVGVGVAVGLSAAGPAIATDDVAGGIATDGAAGGTAVPAARSVRVLRNRVSLGLPRKGARVVSRNATRIPAHLTAVSGLLQIVGAGGQDSPPARLGQPLVLSDSGGHKLLSETLTLSYDRTSGTVRLVLTLQNLGISASGTGTIVRSEVSIVYRR